VSLHQIIKYTRIDDQGVAQTETVTYHAADPHVEQDITDREAAGWTRVNVGGRPALPEGPTFSVKLEQAMVDQLDELAAQRRTTRVGVIRSLLEVGLAYRGRTPIQAHQVQAGMLIDDEYDKTTGPRVVATPPEIEPEEGSAYGLHDALVTIGYETPDRENFYGRQYTGGAVLYQIKR
jgi:hypothetical protein